MDQLCCGFRRYYDATVFEMMKPDLFRKVFDVAALVDKHAPNNINKALYQLMSNYMKIDRAPQYRSVFGPLSLSYHVHDTYKKVIYVFGELHNLPCNKVCKKSMINVHDFISMQFAITPAFIDCYIELPFVPRIDHGADDKSISEHLDRYFPAKTNHLGMIGRSQIECLDRGLRKENIEKCRTGRRHYLDIRYNHDGSERAPFAIFYMDGIVNGVQLLGGHEKMLISISRRVGWLDIIRNMDKSTDVTLSELRISSSSKSVAVWNILKGIAKVVSDKEIKHIIAELALEEPDVLSMLEKSTYLQKEIRRSVISSEIQEHIQNSLKKALGGTYKRRKRLYERYSSSNNIIVKIDALTALVPIIRKIANVMMDGYMYSRIFKDFTNAERDCHPVSPSNIIVYVGEQHARAIRQFLSSIDFRELQSIKTDKPEKGLSLQEISQPFFRDAAEVCNRV